MKNLVVPIAGKSTRFPNTRPKWLLTHPKKHNFMATESIQGLNLDFFDRIIFITLKSYQEKYKFEKGFKEELNLLNKSEIIYLDSPTNSQSETVYHAIKIAQITGFLMVKDSDNYFECHLASLENQICYYDLNNSKKVNPSNKSYLQFSKNNTITNIVEKKVISPFFSIGGYCFKDAEDFLRSFKSLSNIKGECYISNVIFDLILKNNKFYGIECSSYKDWGTKEDWNSYKSTYQTLFIDLDGTLVTQSSYKFPPYIGNSKPLTNNIKWLQDLYKKGKIEIVITTSRPERYLAETKKELKEKNIPYDHLIMGLLHSKRVLINDFANSNPYPSCQALNIPREGDNLTDYI